MLKHQPINFLAGVTRPPASSVELAHFVSDAVQARRLAVRIKVVAISMRSIVNNNLLLRASSLPAVLFSDSV